MTSMLYTDALFSSGTAVVWSSAIIYYTISCISTYYPAAWLEYNIEGAPPTCYLNVIFSSSSPIMEEGQEVVLLAVQRTANDAIHLKSSVRRILAKELLKSKQQYFEPLIVPDCDDDVASSISLDRLQEPALPFRGRLCSCSHTDHSSSVVDNAAQDQRTTSSSSETSLPCGSNSHSSSSCGCWSGEKEHHENDCPSPTAPPKLLNLSTPTKPKQNTKKKSSTPSILNRVYFDRSVVLHKLISCMATNYHQILILGAGLDSSYNQYGTSVYAVDVASVLLKRHELLVTEHNFDETILGKEHLVSCNLNDPDVLHEKLKVANFDYSAKTTVLVECVFVYMDDHRVANLLRSLARSLKFAHILIYEPSLHDNGVMKMRNPSMDGYSSMLRDQFIARGSPPSALCRTQSWYREMLVDTGWRHVVAVANMQVALRTFLSPSEMIYPIDAEPFDEFASLALMRRRYMIALATLQPTDHDIPLHWHIWRRSNQSVIPDTSNPTLNQHVNILVASKDDYDRIAQIIKECFESLSKKHPPVRKFVSRAIKSVLKEKKKRVEQENKMFDCRDKDCRSSTTFFVARSTVAVYREAFIGCVGVRATMTDRSRNIGNRIGGDGANSPVMVFEICHLCVEDSSRRCGVGSALLQAALRYCHTSVSTVNPTGTSRAYCRAHVELSVLGEMCEARKLYEKHGFTIVKASALVPDSNLELLHMSLR